MCCSFSFLPDLPAARRSNAIAGDDRFLSFKREFIPIQHDYTSFRASGNRVAAMVFEPPANYDASCIPELTLARLFGRNVGRFVGRLLVSGRTGDSTSVNKLQESSISM
jgi:hypothetical protein